MCNITTVCLFFIAMLNIQNLSQYLELYNQRQKNEKYSDTVVPAFAYDAIWALALALNKTEEQTLCQLNVIQPCRMRVCTLLTRVVNTVYTAVDN